MHGPRRPRPGPASYYARFRNPAAPAHCTPPMDVSGRGRFVRFPGMPKLPAYLQEHTDARREPAVARDPSARHGTARHDLAAPAPELRKASAR